MTVDWVPDLSAVSPDWPTKPAMFRDVDGFKVIESQACWQASLVPWLNGRTLVFDQRAFAVLPLTTDDGRPLVWVNRPLQVSQLSLSSFRGWYMSSKLQLDVVTTVHGGAIWWTQTKAKGRHGVVCRLNCVIYVWAPWGRDACHLGRYINQRTFTFRPSEYDDRSEPWAIVSCDV